MKKLELSLVIPLYNEAENLPVLVEEIDRALPREQWGFEAIFINDGSTDGSLETLRQLAARHPWMRLLHLERNCGQSAAFAAGFRAARAPVVVTLDADLQNDPADIPRLMAALDGCDVVSGIRARRQDSWARRVASRIANRVRNWVVRDAVSDVGCSLKVYRRELLLGLPCFNGMHRFLPALVKMNGARIREIPIHHRPRIHGVSKYTINNRLWRGLRDLIGVRWLQSRWVPLHLAQEVHVLNPSRQAPAEEPDSMAGVEGR